MNNTALNQPPPTPVKPTSPRTAPIPGVNRKLEPEFNRLYEKAQKEKKTKAKLEPAKA